ncbi:carbohydrate kinase [Flaviflexus salsibiostraticola]|uniref:Carbohydrate kinase n=1 Tax=Flaviflexus salsibiostraticola TaxID=1282737 RepID=A0A3Q8WW25_9ACTO|nr:carbohydrate kinase [Flaviflexus salsibiostraticola]AZN30493.1 carbohydrate kinase [Flaviflexus salsibiostraticola]
MISPGEQVLCVGEALIDVVTRGRKTSEHVGGSPFNVAAGLARLGHPTSLASWWGGDAHGHLIERTAAEYGIDVIDGSNRAERTSVATATIDDTGSASYEFDLLWEVPTLPSPKEISHLHVGSIGATLEPGAMDVFAAVKRMAIQGTVSYDPNLRPAIMKRPGLVRNRIEQIVGHCDVVKASDEDLEWLYPDTPVEEIMRRWAAMGPALIVVTRGPWGSYARLAGDRDMLVIDALDVEVVDTVGAGDSFMSGLLSGLLDAGLLGSASAKAELRRVRWHDVQPALHRGVVTAGLTVSQEGAYAPTRDEVDNVVIAQPLLR